MKSANRLIILLLMLTGGVPAEAEPAPVNNLPELPKDYRNFRLISVSQRADDHSLRAILGNDTAVEAARSGKTQPWPEGSLLAKLVWKQKPNEQFTSASVPGEFSSIAIMRKDSKSHADTGGWGFGEWSGVGLKPYDKPGFAQECFACHNQVKSQDWVFTRPALLP